MVSLILKVIKLIMKMIVIGELKSRRETEWNNYKHTLKTTSLS